LGGVLEAGVGYFGAAQHSGYFVGAGAVVEDPDAGLGAAVFFALFNGEVLISEGCYLGQVGYAKDLLGTAQSLELVAYRFGGAASYANVDFVEDEGAGSDVFSIF
jgi:hypothetical protein